MASTQPPNYSYRSSCVRQSIRETITDKEKWISFVIFFFYVPLTYLTLKNVLKFYKKERKKQYHFIPTINLLLFTAVYSKMAVLMDSFPILLQISTPLFEDISVYNFLSAWAFTSMCLSSTYISVVWANILSSIVVIKDSHKTFKLSVRAMAVLLTFLQVAAFILVSFFSLESH